jgi:SAM-dependent methyltransferase
MSKQNEIDYLNKIGKNGQNHALNKPFSDPNCGLYLHDIGIIMSLLPPIPARLLDLGAGSGWTSCFFAMRGYDVVAQDIAEDMIDLIQKNKKKYGVENLTTINSDYENLGFVEEFDCGIFYDCLHHAEDEYKALSSAYNALKMGGILITAEPGVGHAQALASQKAIKEYGVTEKDMPPEKIIEIAKSIGFRKFQIYLRQTNPIRLLRMKAFMRLMLNFRGHRQSSNFVMLTK